MKTYPTLEALASENLEDIKAGNLRPYRVKHGDKTEYVITNSPGQAALAVCEVDTCTQKQLQTALLNVLLEQAKSDESPQKKS